MIRFPVILGALLVVTASSTAYAQCPDGTPPPCRRPTATTSVAKRVDPALNQRSWIVVPFANAMRANDLDWLRDGSANLLSLDLGRWTDISVVPDKRVADLIRELPPQRAAAAFSLSDGLTLARRAGAGKLVMGDFFRVGRGARLVASVFDVKSGAKLRTVTQHAAEPDSLLTAFGPLARGVLAVPPPVDAKTGEIGTTSLEAYQAYLLGVKALNRFDLAESRKQLSRALAIDSTFALAHLQFAMMLQWDELPTSLALAKSHSLAAQRLGASLPRRERALIDAGVAMADANFPRVCSIARSLLAQDTTDIQGHFLLGECSYHDDTIDWSASDSSVGMYRGNWNTAIRSFERVRELDPTYLGAFEHVIQLLQRTRRGASWILRSGDSLEIVAVRPGNTAVIEAQRERFRKEKPLLASHALAVKIAQRWVDADPTSENARIALIRASLMKGDLATADAQLSHITLRVSGENLSDLRLMLEAAAKRGRGTLARAIFDTLVKTAPDNPSNAAARGAIDLMFGRLRRFDAAGAAAAARLGKEALAYQRHVGRALLGLPTDGMARDEEAFYLSMRDSSCNESCRLQRVYPTLVYRPHEPSGTWATAATRRDNSDVMDMIRALAARDTAALRRTVRASEAEARARAGREEVDARSMMVADVYLLLGDSASALRTARFYVDTSMALTSIATYMVPGLAIVNEAATWPRMMLMRADLAAAAGHRDEAREWYVKVLDLWADADAEMQPTLARIRAAVARLGPRS